MPPSPQLGLESNKPGPSGQSNLDSQTCAGEELYSEDQEHHGQLTVRVHSETEVGLHSSDSDSSSEADELRIFQEFSRTRLDSDDESEPEQHYCSYCREVREVSALSGALHANFVDTVSDNVRCLTGQPIKLLVKQCKQPSQNNF